MVFVTVFTSVIFLPSAERVNVWRSEASPFIFVVAFSTLGETRVTFDTSSLDWVRIDLGRGRIPGAYGRCWYPTRKPKKGYRISIQVPGPFPYNRLRYIKPLYQNDDGSWPPIPPWAKPTGYCEATRNGVVRRWRRLTTEYRMETRETGLVHVFAHEMFHFLHRSRQSPAVTERTKQINSPWRSKMNFAGAPPATKSPINVWQ